MQEGKPIIGLGKAASQIISFVKEVGCDACLVDKWETCSKIDLWNYHASKANKIGIIEETSSEYFILNTADMKIIPKGKLKFQLQNAISKKK